MKRTIPLLITAIAGFVLIVSFFIPAYQEWGESAAVWFDILASIAFILGGGNLLKLHLQKISDRRPGWGYSGVTLIAFLATLVFGLLKLGAPPEPNVEYFGESFASFPLSDLPEFSVPGTIPVRADGKRLPDSVLVAGGPPLLREEGGVLTFRGWMRPNQRNDLLAFHDTLAWKCSIEQLFAAAQPPPAFRGRLTYYTPHRTLSFRGYMSDEDRQALEKLLPTDAGQRAITQLANASRRTISIDIDRFPELFVIPESAAAFVTREGNTLTVRGPISVPLREEIASRWPNSPRVRPLTQQQQQALLMEIEAHGAPLNGEQRELFGNFLLAVWTDDQLIQAINTAGISLPQPKTACEFLAEVEAGVDDPERDHPAGEPKLLNVDQQDAVREFVRQPDQTRDQLIDNLRAAGELTDGQAEAAGEFLDSQPTVAEQYHKLAFLLLGEGPLSPEQREFLLSGMREQFRWRQAIGRLFIAAHQVKHPWSGDYSAQGTPFWWIYAYVFQPLITTTFAMLAFYVASAAYRAFRAKNLEAILLLGTAFIILLGRTFAGYLLTAWVPDAFSALKIDQMTVYIMAIFNTAGNRAIMIGIALGIASTSLKVLLGVDRSYLGSGDD